MLPIVYSIAMEIFSYMTIKVMLLEISLYIRAEMQLIIHDVKFSVAMKCYSLIIWIHVSESIFG